MTRNRSKARFWTVLGVINLLVLAYPMNLFLDSTNQDGTMMAVIVLCAALLVTGGWRHDQCRLGLFNELLSGPEGAQRLANSRSNFDLGVEHDGTFFLPLSPATTCSWLT